MLVVNSSSLLLSEKGDHDRKENAYLLFTNKCIQHLPQNWLQPSADDVEGNVVRDAEPVKLPESGIDLERLFHDFEPVVKWDVQRPPHLFRDVAEGSLARTDLLVQQLAAFGAASMIVEEDMAGILHEDGAVEIWRMEYIVSSVVVVVL